MEGIWQYFSSRNSDGNVPNVNWNSDNRKLHVNWYNPDDANGHLRARQKSPMNKQRVNYDPLLFKYLIQPLAILDICCNFCSSTRYFLSVMIFSSHINRVSLLPVSIFIFNFFTNTSFLSLSVKAAAMASSRQSIMIFSVFLYHKPTINLLKQKYSDHLMGKSHFRK